MTRTPLLIAAALLLLAACAAPPRAPETRSQALVRVSPGHYPDFAADLGPPATLAQSVSRSMEYLAKLPPESAVEFGQDSYTVSELSESLSALYVFLLREPGREELAGFITGNFDVYVAAGFDGLGSSLMTGYYTPQLYARREPGAGYFYPLYGVPDDLVSATPSEFGRSCDEDVLRGRVDAGRLVPYYTRAEIDGYGALEGRGLELAWCNDPVDVFFLQVQGSGVLRFPDGGKSYANYGAQNGRPYRSIGKLLVDEGKADLSTMSMDWLYDYLHEHPDEVGRVLSHNESYVFFRLDEAGPYGSLGVPVTPERSIATDRAFFPQGALAFIVTESPEFSGGSAVPTAWGPYSRFVTNQDTGGAIKGPGRVDIYFGDDETARSRAGNMRRFGELYFLAGKKQR